MARLFSYPDSRALFGACFAMRASQIEGIYPMENLIQTARDNMRAAYDRADAHRQFATMYECAGMTRLADARLKEVDSESHMAGVWAGFYVELTA